MEEGGYRPVIRSVNDVVMMKGLHPPQSPQSQPQPPNNEPPAPIVTPNAPPPPPPPPMPPQLQNNLVTLPPSTAKSFFSFLQSEMGGGGRSDIIPLFWHISKSGGTTVEELCSRCFNLVKASGKSISTTGEIQHDDEDNGPVKVIFVYGLHKVNVDMSTIEGIARAKQQNLIQSSLAQIIFTPHIHESSTLFTSTTQKGQLFTVFRHPIHRAVSLFHYLQHASWEPTYNPKLKDMSIEDYAMSEEHVEEDWMVRKLVNKMEGPLMMEDLELAKEIVRTKCIVGLMDHMEESMRRFSQVFGWNNANPSSSQQQLLPSPSNTNDVNQEIQNLNVQTCMKNILEKGGENKFAHPTEVEGSMAWELLKLKNVWDMQLYEYVLFLFEEQAILFQ